VGTDEQHLALPKLYGAPAYARPSVVPVAPVDRPFDLDDLPLEVAQTEEERELLAQVVAQPYSSDAGEPVAVASGRGGRGTAPMLRGRPFRLGSIRSRFRGDDGSSAGA
jgi:hypothetical protein